jgi:hypothetical protein
MHLAEALLRAHRRSTFGSEGLTSSSHPIFVRYPDVRPSSTDQPIECVLPTVAKGLQLCGTPQAPPLSIERTPDDQRELQRDRATTVCSGGRDYDEAEISRSLIEGP